MKIKRLTLGVGIIALLALGFFKLKEEFTVRTSASAQPADVTFLRLPPTASRIGFFQDGVNFLAEFSLSESEFREVFGEFQFSEMSNQWAEVTPKRFGDSKIFERNGEMQPVVVTNGLRYQQRYSNGGGYNIIFDRAHLRAYYDFAKR